MTLTLRDRIHVSALTPDMDGKEVVVAGWLENVRDVGGLAFGFLRDGVTTAQIVIPKKKLDAALVETLVKTHRESVLALRARVQKSDKARGGFELFPLEVSVLNLADAPLPLGIVDKVNIDLDTRLDNRFMDVRRPEVQAIFRIRSAALAGGRNYLLAHGFTEVHTPNIIATSSEGGTELFPVQYFETKAYLSQSPQLYKQMLMATGLDRVFEIAKYFRAESHNTTRHLNESTAFDCEIAYVDSEEDVMHLLEHLVAAIWNHVHETCQPQLAAVGKTITVPKTPFPRVTYDEARDLVKARGIDVPWGDDLSREAEKVLGEIMTEKGHEFYFITRYPKKAKPFYAHPEGELSRSFDLAHKGMEVTSGAQRVHDPKQLEENLVAKGLDPKAFDDYLKAFRYGMPPHGGFGLGVERLCMEMLGLENVREAVLFPRDRTRLRP